MKNIRIRIGLVLLSLIGILNIEILHNHLNNKEPEALKVNVCSENNKIKINWNNPSNEKYRKIHVKIYSDEENILNKDFWYWQKGYAFKKGIHGKKYSIEISGVLRGDRVTEPIRYERLFLDYSQLPDIPTIVINTLTGIDPYGEKAEKPDLGQELWGEAVACNEYVTGNLLMDGNNIKRISTGIEIRVRGNTSSVGTEKKSYKIHLNKAYPMLGNNELVSDEWLLLNNGNSLNTYVGDYLSDLCEVEWTPHMMFVNVILNGDWKGCYCLTPAVTLNNSNGLVSDTGYIFECDAYWWKPETAYFRTENQIYQMAYTFKYPRFINNEDERIFQIQNYMQTVENYLIKGDKLYQDYIDESSFAKWILVRDVGGTGDFAGSNLYYYKYDYDEENPTNTKIKMGPLWDFDTLYEPKGQWAASRTILVSYFEYLFKQLSFQEIYLNEWLRIMPELQKNIETKLNDLEIIEGMAVDESWELEKNRWQCNLLTVSENKERAFVWFEGRIRWMNNELMVPAVETSTLDISDYQIIKGHLYYNVEKTENMEQMTFYDGWAFVNGYKGKTDALQVGLKVGNKFYFSNMYSRQDVKEYFNLNYDNTGFKICIGKGIETELCIVDMNNKKIYTK